MASQVGVLSVKERLAQLQSGNTNPVLSGAPKPAAKPKPAPSVSTPTPGPEFPVKPLKPVTAGVGTQPFTPLKPGAPTNSAKPNSPSEGVKPVTPFKSGAPTNSAKPNSPSESVKPVTPFKPGAPTNSAKPNSPSEGVKPVTLTPQDESNASKPVFPVQLRHVQKPAGVGPRPAGNKPTVAVAPLVPRKSDAGSNSETTSPDSDETKDSAGAGIPAKRLSIAERMAALKEKAGGDADSNSKPKENDTGPTSPIPPKSPGIHKAPRIPTETGVKRLAHLQDPTNKNFTVSKTGVQNGVQAANGVVLSPKGALKPPDKRRSSELFLRKSDQQKFRTVELPSKKSQEPAPAKPSKFDIDLSAFVLEYAQAKEQVLKEDSIAQGDTDNGEFDELYVEAESTSVSIRGTRKSLHRTTSVRVSKIPEMTAEEEEMYDDCASAEEIKNAEEPEECYDDCASGLNQEDEETDEVYEAFPDDLEPGPSPPPLPSPLASPSTDDKKAKKDKEKEKEKDKEKEKEKDKDKGGKKKGKDETNKKEEKERKKKEEEERKMRNKFGLKDTDEKVGEGVVLHDEAGSSWLIGNKDLSVSQGEIVTILRMNDNPTGKWLVQNASGKMGYVNSNNIEVSTPTIRHVMTGLKGDHSLDDVTTVTTDDGPDEVYEEMPAEGDMDEIYEECS